MKINARCALVAFDGATTMLTTDNAGIRIVFVSDEIVRVRASWDREFAEESHVLDTVAWPDRLEPLFPERRRVEPVMPERSDNFRKYEGVRTISAPGREPSSFDIYDDGVSNNHLEGGWALCRCSLSGKEAVELSFGREGSCEDSVEEVEVEMVAKEKSHWWVAFGDECLERFLNRRKWEGGLLRLVLQPVQKGRAHQVPKPQKGRQAQDVFRAVRPDRDVRQGEGSSPCGLTWPFGRFPPFPPRRGS